MTREQRETVCLSIGAMDTAAAILERASEMGKAAAITLDSYCDDLKQMLEDDKPAPVTRGRWIEVATDIVCSNCKAAYDSEVGCLYKGELDLQHFNGFEYCPHCGARMDGDRRTAPHEGIGD